MEAGRLQWRARAGDYLAEREYDAAIVLEPERIGISLVSKRPVSLPEYHATPRRRRWHWRRLPLCALVAYVLWCTVLYFLQDRLIFRRDLVPWMGPDQVAWGNQAVRMKTNLDAGGQVEAWFLPAPQASPQHPAPLIVFFHGNAERIEQEWWFVRRYHALGCSVLLPEYRGYGRSAGSPSQEGIMTDAVGFYDSAAARPDVDRARIVFHGVSLGSGVAAQLAARRKPAGLILQSAFSNLAVMAHKYLAPASLATNPFRTDEVLPTLDIPVLITHGTRDTVVPIWHARRLRELARHASYIEYDCGHNDLPPAAQTDEHWRKIAAFLKNCGVMPARRPTDTREAGPLPAPGQRVPRQQSGRPNWTGRPRRRYTGADGSESRREQAADRQSRPLPSTFREDVWNRSRK